MRGEKRRERTEIREEERRQEKKTNGRAGGDDRSRVKEMMGEER